MNLLHPWLIAAGAALAALPVLIHIFDRRRLPEQLLPTLRFLHAASEQVKRRIRLRDALLLALRVLAIMLVALAAALPFWPLDQATSAPAAGGADVVYVLDASFGMRYRADGATLFDRARKRAADEAKALAPGQEAAVMLCDDRWTPLSESFVAGDRVGVLIDKAAPGDAPANWAECLRGALAVAGKSKNRGVDIRLFTNLAAAGWNGDALPAPPKERRIALTIIDVAGAELPNHAVTGLELARGYGNGGEQWTAFVDAANFGPPAGNVAVKLEAEGGALMAQGIVDWPGPGPQRKALSVKPAAKEFVAGAARLDADALAEDDDRPFRFYFGKPVGVLVLDGAPGTLAEESESYFAVTALRPGRAESSIEPRVLTRTTLEPKDLEGVQAVFMLNVGELGGQTLRLLERFVDEGGGLFWSMGDRVAADGYAGMASLLPGRLRTLRDLRGRNESVTLKSFPAKHPLFADMGQANLATAAFQAYQQLEQLPAGVKVLLEFSDGSPALVEMARGRGRILWFASTLDDAWTNLPYRPFFLPLLQQSARYLAGTLKPAMQRTVPLGGSVDLAPVLAGRKGELRTPAGKLVPLGPQGGAVVSGEHTRAAGLYQVSIGGRPAPEGDFVVVRRPEASDLTRIDPARLEAQIAAAGFGGTVESGGPGRARRFDPLTLALGLLAIVMLGEAAVAKRGAR